MNLKQRYKRIFPVSYIQYLKEELVGCKSVLDLGCGSDSPFGLVGFEGRSMGVDGYVPSIRKSERRNIHSNYLITNIKDLRMSKDSFDAVLCLDLIEHLNKEDGYELINNMEIWAKKKVIIYTPNGFLEQRDEYNDLQEHISGWNVYDFKRRGYSVTGINGLKNLRTTKADIRFKPQQFFRVFSDLTQKLFTKNNPHLAFQLFAVKDMEAKE